MTYRLHPVSKSDLDLRLYLLVKDAATYGGTKFLVFPSLLPLLDTAPQNVREQDAIVLFYSESEWMEPYNPFDDEDDEPSIWFSYYATATVKDGRLSWTEHRDLKLQQSPTFPDVREELADALGGLIATLEGQGLADTPWHARLTETLAMMRAGANEQHVLHNAGLYDAVSLQRLLATTSLPDDERQSLFDAYVRLLKTYAMYVVNSLDWQRGGVKYSNPSDNASPKATKPSSGNQKAVEAARPRKAAMTQEEMEAARVDELFKKIMGPAPSTSFPPSVPPRKRSLWSRITDSDNRILLVAVFVITMLLLLLAIWSVQYAVTGAVTIISGAVIGQVVTKIQLIKAPKKATEMSPAEIGAWAIAVFIFVMVLLIKCASESNASM